MAMSASDRLKQILADKLKANKEKENESQPTTKETEIPKLLGTNDGKASEQVPSEASSNNESSTKLEEKSQVSDASDSSKDLVESSSIELEKIETKSVFFDTPLSRMMQEFQTSLDNKLPGMASILRDIHLHLKKDPECVTQLSDEEIGTIVRGLESIQGQTIVTSPKTGKSKSGKSAPIVASML